MLLAVHLLYYLVYMFISHLLLITWFLFCMLYYLGGIEVLTTLQKFIDV